LGGDECLEKEHKPGFSASSSPDQAGFEEDTSLDFSKIKNFFANKKRNATLLTLLLILIPVALTFYVRLLPEYLPQTDAWAENSVNSYYRSQIANVVNSQYPNLPQANKDQLINQQFAEFQKNNKEMIQQQTDGTSNAFKQGFRYDENGMAYTFLGDLDSYYYLRQARTLVETGSTCDEIKDGKCWDTHLLAPFGDNFLPSIHPYGVAVLYKILHFLNPAINLMKASFLLPTVLAAIAAIAAFFLARRLMNEVAGFFAAMFVSLNPMLITRTLGSDTDIWNIVLPLIIVWVFIEAFEAEHIAKKLILGSIAGFLIGVFAFAWSAGWWYIFDMIVAATAGYFIILLVKDYFHHKNLKKAVSKEVLQNLAALGIFCVISAVFVSLFLSFKVFASFATAPLAVFSTLKSAAHANLWPNVFTTVAELNEANLETIVAQSAFGVNWLFALALMGIVLSMTKKEPGIKEYLLISGSVVLFLYLVSNAAFNLSPYLYVAVLAVPLAAALLLYISDKHNNIDIKPAILFTLWFIWMIIASIKGVRFILLLTPIFSIAVGVAIGYVFQYCSRIVKKELKVSEAISHLAVFIVLCMLLTVPIKAGIAAGENFTPSMTRGWWDTLTKIRTESAPDAIINSWWDFGHWFKYVADRRVTLDGVTQNHPNAHWLGLILQTSNEREAIGILRMLDCGSNRAFETVNSKYNDTEISENIISELVEIDAAEGEKYLAELGYSPEQISNISGYMYCSPPENYFITSEDMVGKAGVWAHFGLWNFDKAYMINVIRPKGLEEGTALLKERFNYSDSEATSIYYELQALQSDAEMNNWISPWPNYFTGDWLGCVEQNTTVEDEDLGISYVTNRTLLCGINRVVNQDANSRTVIEGAVFSYDNPEKSFLVISSFNNAGTRLGSGQAIPASFKIMDDYKIETIEMKNTTFGMDVLIDGVNKRLLMVDPQLSESMFTKLFYLEGRYTKHFEKFSDITDVTGLRIIVWKVKWPDTESTAYFEEQN